MEYQRRKNEEFQRPMFDADLVRETDDVGIGLDLNILK